VIDVIMKNNLLKGTNTSVIPGTSVAIPLAAFNVVTSWAHATKKPLYIFAENKSAAYDSVEFDLLKLSLKRLGLPDEFISLYFEGTLEKREVRIIKSFCLTRTIKMSRGVPQEGIECPLFWNTFYDPLLCRLRDEFIGATLTLDKPDAAYNINENMQLKNRNVKTHETREKN
jgi:hypothetical protein